VIVAFDREIAGLEALERRYPDEAGKRLADFIRAMEAR